jgi:hypothetical protein
MKLSKGINQKYLIPSESPLVGQVPHNGFPRNGCWKGHLFALLAHKLAYFPVCLFAGSEGP